MNIHRSARTRLSNQATPTRELANIPLDHDHADPVILIVSPALSVRYVQGLPRTLVGTHLLAPIDPSCRQLVSETLDKITRTGEPQCFEFQARWPDGANGHYMASAERINDTDATHGIVITGRGRGGLDTQQERLRQRELQLRALTENLPVLIAYVDSDERYRFNSGAYERWFGVNADAIYGKRLIDVLGASAYAAIEPHVQAALAGQTVSFEAEVPYASAGTRVVSAVYTPDVDDSGNVLGFVAVINEITERRQAEARLQKAQEELAHASRLSTVGELTSTMAHELTQPLTAITHYADALEALLGTDSSKEATALAHQIVDQAFRATAIIKDIRSWVRKGPGNEAARTRVTIDTIVAELRELVIPTAQTHGANLEVQLPDEPLELYANSLQITQVLFNLVRNAIEAMVVSKSPRRSVAISVYSDRRCAHIVVTDTGPGVEADWQDRIFDLFETTKRGGMGMGLNISRSLIEAHGGNLWLEPASLGARFHIMLPLGDTAGC